MKISKRIRCMRSEGINSKTFYSHENFLNLLCWLWVGLLVSILILILITILLLIIRIIVIGIAILIAEILLLVVAILLLVVVLLTTSCLSLNIFLDEINDFIWDTEILDGASTNIAFIHTPELVAILLRNKVINIQLDLF